MTDDIVDKILKTALEKAFDEKYCLTCKYSYLNYLTGTGYCRFSSRRKYNTPKNILENSFCKHWKKKT